MVQPLGALVAGFVNDSQSHDADQKTDLSRERPAVESGTPYLEYFIRCASKQTSLLFGSGSKAPLERMRFVTSCISATMRVRQAVGNEVGKTARITFEISKPDSRARARKGNTLRQDGIQRQESNRSRFSQQYFYRQCPSRIQRLAYLSLPVSMKETRESSTTHAPLHKVSPKYIYIPHPDGRTNLTRILSPDSRSSDIINQASMQHWSGRQGGMNYNQLRSPSEW